jgi:hypothetical protein
VDLKYLPCSILLFWEDHPKIYSIFVCHVNKNRVWIDVLLRSCKEMSQESFGYSIQCYCSHRALRLAYNVHLQKILCISEVSVRQNHGKTSCSLVLSTSSGVLRGLRTIWMTGFKTIRSGKALWDLHYSISAKENSALVWQQHHSTSEKGGLHLKSWSKF